MLARVSAAASITGRCAGRLHHVPSTATAPSSISLRGLKCARDADLQRSQRELLLFSAWPRSAGWSERRRREPPPLPAGQYWRGVSSRPRPVSARLAPWPGPPGWSSTWFCRLRKSVARPALVKGVSTPGTAELPALRDRGAVGVGVLAVHQEVAAAKLAAQRGLQGRAVSKDRITIAASGTAAQVERAFGTGSRTTSSRVTRSGWPRATCRFPRPLPAASSGPSGSTRTSPRRRRLGERRHGDRRARRRAGTRRRLRRS